MNALRISGAGGQGFACAEQLCIIHNFCIANCFSSLVAALTLTHTLKHTLGSSAHTPLAAAQRQLFKVKIRNAPLRKLLKFCGQIEKFFNVLPFFSLASFFSIFFQFLSFFVLLSSGWASAGSTCCGLCFIMFYSTLSFLSAWLPDCHHFDT